MSGTWEWTLVVDKGDARVVERESWHLDLAAGKSHYDREVIVIATGRIPFVCSQTYSYTLRTRYELEVVRHAKGATVRELQSAAEESPCDDGKRTLKEYQARLTDAGLVVHGPQGTQTLRPGEQPPLVKAIAKSAIGAGFTAAGTWQWRLPMTDAPGEASTQAEIWTLTDDAGEVAGEYTRRVTLADEALRSPQCAENTTRTLSDTFRLRGQRVGNTLTLSEVDVTKGTHPCLRYLRRHLDVATGTVFRNHIELVWRGQHRQVLHRHTAPTPAATNSQP